MSFFNNLEKAPIDPILGITVAFNADPRKTKVNLGVGTYKTADLKPYVLSSVYESEKELWEEKRSKEYLPIEGDHAYLSSIIPLIFGEDFEQDRLAALQTIGGTGALSLGARFIQRHLEKRGAFIPEPTWDNHARVFSYAGFEIGSYPYYDRKNHRLDLEGLLSFLETVPEGSILVIQVCCHNPTGLDPTHSDWESIANRIESRRIFPFFDLAYQGFGDNLEEDVWAIRYFANRGIEFALAASFSKNFGLYAERVGALFINCTNVQVREKVQSQLKVLARSIYSNPPCHGVRIVSHILKNDKLRGLWESELRAMRSRIQEMRKSLVSEFCRNGLTQFSFIEKQKGMFSLTWISEDSVNRLISDFGIYMPKNGRINLAGLNSENLSYVVQSIAEVL